jgi:group I intron endonuclease
MMDTGHIYLIRNRVNGKVYVGQTHHKVKTRWKAHAGSRGKNTRLEDAIVEFGVEAFEVTTLTTVPKDLLHSWEFHYIKVYDSANPEKGYNMSIGNKRAVVSQIHRIVESNER